jgi:uncharacterized membrane protein YraQ (UPF0718 family)
MLFKKSEKSKGGWIFLFVTIVVFIVVCLIKTDVFLPALKFAFNIVKRIYWVFILVFVLMVLTNYFIEPDKLVKHFGNKKSFRGWFFSIIAGIISTGPIYMWYPWLSDLQKQGIKDGFIATFLYNRAVKIPLLPIMIFYFGLLYVIVLMIVMIFVSVIQGLIMNKIMEIRK